MSYHHFNMEYFWLLIYFLSLQIPQVKLWVKPETLKNVIFSLLYSSILSLLTMARVVKQEGLRERRCDDGNYKQTYIFALGIPSRQKEQEERERTEENFTYNKIRLSS